MSAAKKEDVGGLFETDPAKAEKALMQALKKNPKDVKTHLLLGATRLKLGRYTDAAEAFRDALRAEVNNRPAQVLLATALEHGSDFKAALAAWQQVAKAQPESADAHGHVARLADAVGQPEVGLSARRELVKLKAGSPEVVADLAVYLSRAGQHAEAVRMFERANTLEPGFLEKHAVEAAAYQTSKAAAGKR